MRLLLVLDGLGAGGTERSTAELIPYLTAAGLDVSVVCLRQQAIGVEDDVRSLGIEVVFLNSGGLVGKIRALRGILREQQPDIVHSALYESNLITRLAAAWLPTVVLNSLVNTPYEPARLADPSVSTWKIRVTQAVEATTGWFLVDGFHAVSQAAADSAHRRLGVPRSKIIVGPRGRDRSRLGWPSSERRAAVRSRFGLSDDEVVLIAVGRLDHQKRHVDLIRAIEAMSQPVTTLIVGRDGSASAAVRSVGVDQIRQGRLKLLGHRDDVPDLLAAADIFVSVSAFEGMPGAVLEAMAMRLPVVAFDIAPVREVAPAGVARLVPDGEVSALSRALDEVAAHAEIRTRLGRRAAGRFDELYSLNASGEALIKVYDWVADADG